MTQIPEHLLKRAGAVRAAIGRPSKAPSPQPSHRPLTVAERAALAHTPEHDPFGNDDAPRLQVCKVTGCLIVDPAAHEAFVETFVAMQAGIQAATYRGVGP